MPPRRKKVGRPPGSKNKKNVAHHLIKIAKKKNNKTTNKKKIKTRIDNVQDLECNVCNKKFPSKKELAEHKALEISQVINPKAAYSCEECPKKFKFLSSFEEHISKEHSKLPNSVQCDLCNVRCNDKATLEEHIKKIHERNLYLCPHCQKEFVRQSHVLRHMAQTGCDGANVSLYHCEICNAAFSRKDNLTVHIRHQHILLRDFFCKYCSYNTKNFSSHVKHWHKNHAETPNQYECNDCGKKIQSRAAMTKHLEIHGEKKYSCNVCNYSTYTVEVIRRHVLTHVENKPYKCTQCSASFIQRVQLQRHMEKHNGNLCSVCGESFFSRAKMLIHMRDHLGLKKLFCPVKGCSFENKAFTNENSLTNHLETVHIDNKQHSCEVCEKKFHSEVNLRRHLETHMLDRPRRCMYCVSARAYVRGKQLVRHVRKSHPAIFSEHLRHVRRVLGQNNSDRVKKSEIECVLNLLDVVSDRILQGYSGSGVLYGGMQEEGEGANNAEQSSEKKPQHPLMSEEELADNLSKLITQLIDKETLTLFGWPDESVDVVLERVIEQCGARPADREKWTRVQRLRENTKHLFLYVIEDKNIARMLDTHTIDQIVTHILKQVTEDDPKASDIEA